MYNEILASFEQFKFNQFYCAIFIYLFTQNTDFWIRTEEMALKITPRVKWKE